MDTTELNNAVLETAKSMNQPTVGQLVDSLVKERGVKLEDATRAVYVQYKKGILKLSDKKPPTNLASYLFNLENAWFWAVTALVATTMVVVFTVNASSLLYVRYVLGGFFVLFLPGYLLVSVLYPRSGELDALERVALSIGLSLAIVPLIGLVLNYTPWGIRLEPIMVSLVLFSEVMAAANVVRRFRYFQLSLK